MVDDAARSAWLAAASPRDDGLLEVRVLDAGGTPAAGVTTWIEDPAQPEGTRSPRVESDAAGRLTLPVDRDHAGPRPAPPRLVHDLPFVPLPDLELTDDDWHTGMVHVGDPHQEILADCRRRGWTRCRPPRGRRARSG